MFMSPFFNHPQASAGGLTPGYAANAVDFDGSTFMTAGALTGVFDTAVGICSYWFNPGTAASGGEYIFDVGSNRCRSFWDTTEKIDILVKDASNVTLVQLFTVNTYTNASGWTHVLASWNTLDAAAQRLYVNDTSDKDELVNIASAGATVVDYTRTTANIGGVAGPSNLITGCIAELYLNTKEYLDFDVASNRRKFISSSGKPVDLGSDGSTPTGNAPTIYLKNAASTFGTNLGDGGNFGVADGALTDCSSAPSD